MPTTSLPTSQSEGSISVYSGGNLNTKTVIKQSKRLQGTFPELRPEFFRTLSERVKANKFTDERLEDAINHLIDNFRYPKPTIADIISYDKRIDVHGYSKVCDMVSKGYSWNEFIKMPERKAWVLKADAENAGLKI